MEKRLTKREGGKAYYPCCFEYPCNGTGCKIDGCKLEEEVCKSLADYEDIGTPRGIMAMMAENQRLHRENFWLTSEREPGPRWIAMADKLPPEDGSYIVCTKLGAVCTATFNAKLGRWGHSMYGVTHWMPLPKAPGEESADGTA